MARIKVLHLYSSWTKGGAEKLMLSLIKGLEAKGIKNIIGCPHDSFIFSEAQKMDISVYPLMIRGSFAPVGLYKLFNIMLKERPNVLHSHQGKLFWPCVIMKLLFPKTKIVFHRHAQIPHKFYSRLHYKMADKVIAISNAVAEGLIQSEGVNRKKLEVVYNGVDFSVFNNAVSGETVRQKHNLQNCVVIGTAAAMNKPKGKGQQYLIEAAALLKFKYPNAKYLIVGTGEIQNELEKLSVKLGVSDNVIFAGYQENIAAYMAAMDVFCLLSWEMEGLGQVMLEAQALGKPVIGTNVGGVPETFVTGETGYLIPKENSTELARIIELFLKDEHKRIEMGKKANSFVTKHFSYDQMISKVKAIYEAMF